MTAAYQSQDPYIEWNSSLMMGFAEIDAQHQCLVKLFNQLAYSVHEQQDLKLSLDALALFIQHCRLHFAIEESLMRVIGYADYQEHRLHHQLLIRQILQLQASIEEALHDQDEDDMAIENQEQEPASITQQQLLFLQRWLVKHIQSEDRAMLPLFKESKLLLEYKNPRWLDNLWQLD